MQDTARCVSARICRYVGLLINKYYSYVRVNISCIIYALCMQGGGCTEGTQAYTCVYVVYAYGRTYYEYVYMF